MNEKSADKKGGPTAERILAAARECLLTDGFSGLSTRRVATTWSVEFARCDTASTESRNRVVSSAERPSVNNCSN